MTTIGSRLATGRTADIFAYGSDAVAKILRPAVPAEWAAIEFELARRIHALDLATPEPRELTTVDGRPAVVFERVDGPSMQSAMIKGRLSVAGAADLLVDIHRRVLACPPPPELPRLSDRLAAKIDAVDVISEEERLEGRRLVSQLPSADRLLHGDLHPNNVILADDGPVIIDWFDASIGHPVADIARSKLLMRSPDTELERNLAHGSIDGESIDDAGTGGSRDTLTTAHAPHLPGATIELLDEFRGRYLSGMSDLLDEAGIDDRTWRNCLAVNALGRVAEQTRPDDGPLLAIWRSRPEPATSSPGH